MREIRRHVARFTGQVSYVVTEDGLQVGPFYLDYDEAHFAAFGVWPEDVVSIYPQGDKLVAIVAENE